SQIESTVPPPGDSAVEKYKTVFGFFRSRSSSDIAFSFTVYHTALKNRRRPAEYKIDSPFDVTVFIVLPAFFTVQVKRVLVAQKLTIFKNGPVTFYPYGYGLP